MDGEIDWKARAEHAEKACAEMRKLLVGAIPSMKCTPFLSQAEKWMQEKTHALSSDCGSGYVRREELDDAKAENARLRETVVEAISYLAIIRDWDDHYEAQWEDPGACAGRGILKIQQALGKDGK